MTDNRPMFEVSADWMKACGMGEEAKAFPVIRSYDLRLVPFADLDLGGGRVFTVITSWRGRYV